MPPTPNRKLEKRYLTPPEIAAELRVGNKKVLTFIKTGELLAVDVGRGKTPRWRITKADFVKFLNKRSNRKQGVIGTASDGLGNFQTSRSNQIMGSL